jgi:hypothetical protein
MNPEQEKMMKKMCHADGFIAALDQSGGSSELFLTNYVAFEAMIRLYPYEHAFDFISTTNSTGSTTSLWR